MNKGRQLEKLVYEQVQIPRRARGKHPSPFREGLRKILEGLPHDKAVKFKVDNKDEAKSLAALCRSDRKHSAYVSWEDNNWVVYAWRKPTTG